MIPVPFVSQWDDDAHLSIGDCGIACACMLALWREISTSPDAMIRKAQLPEGQHSYTFNQVTQSAAAVGLRLVYQSPADWAAIRAELDSGRPVISLLRYGELSGNLDKFVGAHFVVVVGYDQEEVYINDPDTWEPHRAEGFRRVIPLDQFERAIGVALEKTENHAHQALFLDPLESSSK